MISRFRDSGIAVFSLGISLAAAGCSGKKTVSQLAPSASLFSDRPISETADLYVITLRSPPLLAAGNKTQGAWEIPANARKAVLDEQARFERRLAAEASQARIVYRYRLTINGLAIFANASLIDKLTGWSEVSSAAKANLLARPQSETFRQFKGSVTETTSVSFIGADRAHATGVTGKGVRVGIIDTGIDYTHRMLGGRGDESEFKAIDPAKDDPAFPNSKVVGGLDLVGTDFNAASPFADRRLPHPDGNPIDEAGHGTHVAGTVAGIGDNVFTYSGVAPDAQLMAIKVFGKEGSTTDAAVIAGFEFAADPNGDLDPSDQLDVINLSLGGGFGQPRILYNEAVRTLSRAGTAVVASAGNSGNVDYIVGSPSTADSALSVAASVDGSPHNWRFAAVRFSTPEDPNILAKAIEGPISKPIDEAGSLEGEIVDIGFADAELSDELKSRLAGKIAFSQRGKVPFATKLKLAVEAGAVGAVIFNNEPGKPFPMGGEGQFEIPAVMISQALGMNLAQALKSGPVRIQFQSGAKIEEPGLIDTITDFSSRGPRSEDDLLKPEISAPGNRVISAAMGRGFGSVAMDGTSMASPHVAGAIALLRQARPDLGPDDLKALVMNTAKPLSSGKEPIALTLQGAGRIRVDGALSSPIVTSPAALSFGNVQLGAVRAQTREIRVRNLTDLALDLTLDSESMPGLVLTAPASITIAPKGEITVKIRADFHMTASDQYSTELDGRLWFKQNGRPVAGVPALAIRTQASQIRATGKPHQLSLSNTSPVMGPALAFNLLGEDARKTEPRQNEHWKGRSCDLKSAGYRILTKATPTGPTDMIQFAFALDAPVTTWQACDLSVLIDADGDGVADQELAGTAAGPGIFQTVLLNAAKAREVRRAYEMEIASGKEVTPNYQPAILGMGPMAAFPHSTLAIIEAPVSSLATTNGRDLRLKLAAQGGRDVVESDDYLGAGLGDWKNVSISPDAQPFKIETEVIPVGKRTVSGAIARGSGKGKLVLYYPINDRAAGQWQVLR